MEQDVEVALRITEAIMEKATVTINLAGGQQLAQSYVGLFSHVHAEVKRYFNPTDETGSGGRTAPVVRH